MATGKKGAPFTPTPDQLKGAARHVAHDIRMLGRAFENQQSAFAWTAWFIHCRAVMGFLEYRGDSTKDDLYASHYVPDLLNR